LSPFVHKKPPVQAVENSPWSRFSACPSGPNAKPVSPALVANANLVLEAPACLLWPERLSSKSRESCVKCG